jgi:hypothetical protein
MKARDRWKQIQAVLGTAQDGIPGPKDEAALTLLKQQAKSNFDLDTPQPTTLTGRGITLHIEGE